MLDHITELRPFESAQAIKSISMSDDVFAVHFPLFPVFPGALILEGLVELGGWLLAASCAFSAEARLGSLLDVRFRHFVRPGDTLELDVCMMRRDELPDPDSGDETVWRMRGRVQAAGKVVCTVREMLLREKATATEHGSRQRKELEELTRG